MNRQNPFACLCLTVSDVFVKFDIRSHLVKAVACLLFLGVWSKAADQERKNVLFLMSDEHSGRVISVAGNPIVSTPTLDSLAENGVLFKNTYCQNPVCVPSRASLATGKMPSKIGVFDNGAHKNDVLRDVPDSIARVFTSAGYNAEWIGKEHWGTTNAGIGFGGENEAIRSRLKQLAKAYLDFDKSVGRHPKNAQTIPTNITHIRDALYTDHVIDWLDRYNITGTKPFFLGVSLFMPHFPFIVEQEFYAVYKDSINLPRLTEEMIKDLPSTNRFHRSKYNFQNMTDDQIKNARAIYYGMVSFVDHQMGRVVQKMQEMGALNNTIIVYASDHGEMAGEHGLWYKNSFYEDAVRVPLILSYPNTSSSVFRKEVRWPVQLMDIVPTLYELCNISIPEGLDGKSLLPALRGEEFGWRRQAFSETYARRAGRMLRFRRWKYCWYEDGGNQFFDMRADPAEEFNLYNNTEYATIVKYFHRIALEHFIPKPKRV